ncbi:unnamed protein product [Porites lobata]|uniref:Uncharacterized protein n=1 Tax=Porites lobata TaxID=104759 RepID=A0ABN8RP14_9CNID|nr:unnamed protein product [Porites lobata]
MIGRADIEGSKSNAVSLYIMNAWHTFYPCGNFSDTQEPPESLKPRSIGHAFTVCIHTENQNQVSFLPIFVLLHEI